MIIMHHRPASTSPLSRHRLEAWWGLAGHLQLVVYVFYRAVLMQGSCQNLDENLKRRTFDTDM